MCRESKSALPPQQQPQEENEQAAAGVMLSRRELKNGVVRRYNAVERRERIERYRSKRNRRNFKKKIIYTCRQNLAEKRKRVGGRFAHTRDEKPCLPEKTDQTPSSSTGTTVPEWWPPMEVAMARKQEEDSFTNIINWELEMLASCMGFSLYPTTDPSIHTST